MVSASPSRRRRLSIKEPTFGNSWFFSSTDTNRGTFSHVSGRACNGHQANRPVK